MNKENKPAIIPSSRTAVETRRQRSTNGILSGIVGDTLALVKTGPQPKPAFTALLGRDHFASAIEMFLDFRIGDAFNLTFLYFAKSSELLGLAEQHTFDLVFVYIGNITWDISSNDGSYLGAASILADLRARYGKPIITTQSSDLTAELEPRGITFLNVPFTLETFWERLRPQLNSPTP